jgi:hypothetical protein
MANHEDKIGLERTPIFREVPSIVWDRTPSSISEFISKECIAPENEEI